MKKPETKYNQMSIGLNMAVGMAVFSFIGFKLDQKFQSGQTCTLIGMLFGLFYCGYEVWKLTKSSNDKENNDNK